MPAQRKAGAFVARWKANPGGAPPIGSRVSTYHALIVLAQIWQLARIAGVLGQSPGSGSLDSGREHQYHRHAAASAEGRAGRLDAGPPTPGPQHGSPRAAGP